MENNHTLQDKIDDYLLDRMSMLDREAFEKEMAESDQLRQDVELQRMIKDEINERGSFFKIMENAENQKTGTLLLFRSWKFYSIAASVLILITFFIWQPTQMSNEAIVEQYAVVIPIKRYQDMYYEPGLRYGTGVDSLNIERMKQALHHFNKQEYQKASAILEELLVDSEKRAVKYLLEDAKYILSLAYLQQGKRIQTRYLLKSFDPNSTYYDESKEILRQMRWF
jgi:hypothetical protein